MDDNNKSSSSLFFSQFRAPANFALSSSSFFLHSFAPRRISRSSNFVRVENSVVVVSLALRRGSLEVAVLRLQRPGRGFFAKQVIMYYQSQTVFYNWCIPNSFLKRIENRTSHFRRYKMQNAFHKTINLCSDLP